MPEITNETNSAGPKGGEKFWTAATSWSVVAVVVSILLGLGGTFMTSHPYIADAFCLLGIIVLLVKFWTWEGSQHSTPRKTALVLAGGTILSILVVLGFFLLSNYVGNAARDVAKNSTPNQDTPKQTLPSASNATPLSLPSTQQKPAPSLAPSTHTSAGTNTPKVPKKANTNPAGSTSATQDGIGNQQTVQGGTGNQQATAGAGGIAQTMKNSPGGSQTVNQFNQYGAPKLEMTDAQREEITNAMRAFSGQKVNIATDVGDPDVEEYSRQFRLALENAGMIVAHNEAALNFVAGSTSSGVSFVISKDYKPVAEALAKAMNPKSPISIRMPSDNPPDSSYMDIVIRPNR